MKAEFWAFRGIVTAIAILALTACQSTPAPVRQQTPATIEDGWENSKAIVILAADIREKTSVRDNIPHFGSVFFKKVDSAYKQRGAEDYDFAIQYSVGADWKAATGGRDDNRAPHLFLIDPGMYVVELIKVGSGPKTIYRGYDQSSNRVAYGTFEVQAGELVNLGRLVIHMHYYNGTFSQRVEDNTHDVVQYLVAKYPAIKGKPANRFLTVVPSVAFGAR